MQHMGRLMHGSCPDCGQQFDAPTPPALVDLILGHTCPDRVTAVWNADANGWDYV
jgi:hypothetical protein